MDRRLALLLPSLTLLVLTALGWTLWPPPATEPRLPWFGLLAVGLATGGALVGGAALLERTLPSFRRTSRRLERLVRGLRLPPGGALLAALVSGVSEELFFRGWLLPTVGLWWQALLFMLLHPAGRGGWSYTLYTGVAGLVFGGVTLATGSLWPALIAHVAVNLHGFSAASSKAERAWRRVPGDEGRQWRPRAHVVDAPRKHLVDGSRALRERHGDAETPTAAHETDGASPATHEADGASTAAHEADGQKPPEAHEPHGESACEPAKEEAPEPHEESAREPPPPTGPPRS